MKYIVVTGGIISGLGKGITASSVGLLLKERGLNITSIKIDPYLNIDAGTMSPYEHGECYVLKDGGEVDLDLGNYERFLNIDLGKYHNITTGKIYKRVLDKERHGKYLGKTVQVIPHLTDEIQNWIIDVAQKSVDDDKKPDVCIIEVGGTVGDIETAPFIEALRQLSLKLDRSDICFIHVSMIINNGEQKTKPTQHSVSTLRTLGIFPDILVLRTKNYLSDEIKNKLSRFCNINKEHIISNVNVPTIYYVPKIFAEQNICEVVQEIMDLKLNSMYKYSYGKIIEHFENDYDKYKLIIAGKYTGSQDTYLSLIRAIEHASFQLKMHIEIVWLDSEKLDDSDDDLIKLEECDGIIIPGGFGSRGIKGKKKVAKYARINNIPLLGICLGLHVMIAELVQFYGLDGDSTEWWSTSHPVVDILPGQTGILGGTMRLGNYKTILNKKSLTHKLYGTDTIVERHRHRYEVNNKYIDFIESNGLIFVGKNEDGKLMEIAELDKTYNHPFYIGCQFHPELISRNEKAHPLFIGLLQSMKN